MKKIILALAVLCFSFALFAQETDKKISYYHAIEVKGLLVVAQELELATYTESNSTPILY